MPHILKKSALVNHLMHLSSATVAIVAHIPANWNHVNIIQGSYIGGFGIKRKAWVCNSFTEKNWLYLY